MSLIEILLWIFVGLIVLFAIEILIGWFFGGAAKLGGPEDPRIDKHPGPSKMKKPNPSNSPPKAHMPWWFCLGMWRTAYGQWRLMKWSDEKAKYDKANFIRRAHESRRASERAAFRREPNDLQGRKR